MASQIVVALFGAVFLGVVLVLLGLRGKRLNRHPICALCGFDLEGTYPQSITCSECGAGLRRRKGVRIGARRKRWVVLCAGALLVLLPVGMLATALYAVLTGADLNSYKPVGLLLWEGRRANDATAAAAVQELLTRVQNKQVGKGTVENIVATALEIQADLDATWRSEWGDIIETARLADSVEDEAYNRFLEQAAVVEFAIRPRVRQGDPVAVEAKLKEARIGGGSQMYVQAEFTTRTIDGKSARGPVVKGGLVASLMGVPVAEPGDQPGYFQLMGQKSPWGGQSYGQCLGILHPPEGLAPGPHTAKISLVLTAQVPSVNGTTTSWMPMAGILPTARRTRTATLQFVVTDEPTVRLIKPTPEQVAAFREMLTPQTVQLQTSEGGFMAGRFKWVQVNFNASDLPLDAAFSVTVRGAQDSASMHSLMSEVLFRAPEPGAAAPQAMFGPFGAFGQQWVSLQAAAAFDAEKVTIVLEPNLKAALRTVDITEIYGETITLEDVPVSKSQW